MKTKQDKISNEYSTALQKKENTIVANTGNARFADYSDANLDQQQQELLQDSFGCGNPLAFSQIQTGQVVLDLGCGAGLDLLLAAEKVGSEGKVIGVDMNDDMLALAQKNIDASGFNNIELRKGKIENLPVADASVDWVISNCVINLSNDKEKTFSEIARVLAPNGQISISDIVAEKMPWWSGLKNCAIVSRQYYEPIQLAAIVNESLPKFIQKITCCGKKLTESILKKLATPIANKLWSAKPTNSIS